MLAVGTEVTAVGVYMGYWFPDVPRWIWVLVFSAALVGVNATSVKTFGTVEYGFSAIKVAAIVVFILIGAFVVLGAPRPGIGFHNYVATAGSSPRASGARGPRSSSPFSATSASR